MAEQRVGTSAVTGLNVAKGPHLVEDHELRESYNGWTDEDGVWRTAPGPERLYSGYTAISCLAAGRMGGADHVVWLDGNTLYDNGVNVGTITAGTTMDIVALDDVFLILGAAKNYIWDGDVLREQGTLDAAYPTTFTLATPTANAIGYTASITGITKASQAVISTTLAASIGDYIYIDNVAGMTEINGIVAKIVDSVGGVSKTVDIDSTDFTAYSSGGNVYLDACGFAGEYKYYVTATVRLPSGRVLESRPYGVKSSKDSASFTSEEAYTVTATATDRMNIFGVLFVNLAGTAYYTCSGTIGTDYIPGLRLYRTKAGGTDFYLVNSWEHGDSGFTYTYSAPSMFYTLTTYSDQIQDRFLGAVYEPELYDHGNAPQSNVGAFAGQRVLLASGADIYWSDLDGIEYYNNANGFTPLGDVVTAIAPFRDGWAVFSCDRLWYVQIPDGLPTIVEINTPVGTTWPKAMCTVDDGVLFLRDDGLWLFNGARVEKVSRGAFSSITSPQSVTAAGELLFVSGSEKSYVAIRRDGGWIWHESEHYRPHADSTNGKIYAADTFHVEQMFSGRHAGGRLSTKHFGNQWLGKSIRVVLDFEGDTIPTVWVNGNRQSDVLGHADDSSTQYRGRRVVWVSVPRLNNQYLYLTLEATGDCRVYGYWVEVAG